MFRARIFYFLFLFLVLFKNCSPDSDKPIRIDLFYSPVNKECWRFLREKIKSILLPDIGQHLDLYLHPIADCDMRASKHMGDDENNHLPIICTSGSTEAILATEHYCGYTTLAKDENDRNKKRMGMLNGVKYCLCVLKRSHLPADQRIGQCRKTVQKNYREKIEECINGDKAKSLTKNSFELYRKSSPGYYPYILIDNKHKKEWDTGAIENFASLICGILRNKPKKCANID